MEVSSEIMEHLRLVFQQLQWKSVPRRLTSTLVLLEPLYFCICLSISRPSLLSIYIIASRTRRSRRCSLLPTTTTSNIKIVFKNIVAANSRLSKVSREAGGKYYALLAVRVGSGAEVSLDTATSARKAEAPPGKARMNWKPPQNAPSVRGGGHFLLITYFSLFSRY